MVKLTASDFKEPLFKILGLLTNNKAESPVDLKNTYQPICDAMNITINQYGNDPGSGKPRVEKWIQWAFKEYKNKGYTKTMGRGQWALTTAGVKIMTTTDTKDSFTRDTTLASHTLKMESAYRDDAYIRTLAAQETKCFGFYAQQSPICKDCSLNKACVNAMVAELVTISKGLEQKDTKKKNTKPNTIPSKNISKGNAESLLIQQNSICGACGKIIAKGTWAMWVSSTTDGTPGVYHTECYNKDA